MKNISILGSTGSIGRQTLDVIRETPDQLKVYSLFAGKNVEEIEKQARQFKPQIIGLKDEAAAKELKGRVKDLSIKVVQGMQGMIEAVTASSCK